MSDVAPSSRRRHRVGQVLLPASLREALREQFRRTFLPPYETPMVVAINGALMTSAWFLAPPRIRNLLFSVHGTIAFAAVLAAWMYSDVPSTNVLGADAERVVAAIDDPAMLRRMITAKNLVLWTLVTPLCAALAFFLALDKHNFLAGAFAMLWIAVVPFGTLGVVSWVGIRWPYHPMPIKVRLALRKGNWWQMIGRWGLVLAFPYLVLPLVAVVLMLPSLALWGVLTPGGIAHHLPDRDLGLGVLVTCVIAAACWFGGHRVGESMIRRRRDDLLEFLQDPFAG